MDTTELYNLSPALRLMIMGLIVAVGPLAWVWLKSRSASPAQRLRTLTWVTLFLTFDLVIFGAFTRLTDSGLGCPDWPGCYGHASPIGATPQITAAQAAMPTGPVTFPKAWIEMIHRYLATGVGVLILTLAFASWIERRRIQHRDAGPTQGAVAPAESRELHEVNERGGDIIDLTGYTRRIRDLLALFHGAALLIANDGAPGQLSALTKMPAIVFFGPETPALYGPIAPGVFCFHRTLACSPCLTAYNHRLSPCDGDNQCLKQISVDEVMNKALEMLEPDDVNVL